MSLLRKLFSNSVLKPQTICKVLSQQKLRFSSQVDPERLYISPKVQELLNNITGFDIDKILKHKIVSEPEPPKYKLMTDEELQLAQEDIIIEAQKYLQLPPYKKSLGIEDSKPHILSNDEEISMFDKEQSSYAFVDVDSKIYRGDHLIVIRENNGILRLPDLREKERLLQSFYPETDRMMKMPEMFTEERLEEILCPDYYLYILDRSLVQFEPDDVNYNRVTQRTYEHILSTNSFDVLRSTRHFGPMSFYYLMYKKIDTLLCDMLSRDLVKDAAHLVELYCLLHPESDTSKALKDSDFTDSSKVIEIFLNNDSKDKVILELTLNSCVSRNAPDANITSD